MLDIVEPRIVTGAAEHEHPLDPLNAAELARVASVLRDHFDFGGDLRFETVELVEPDKETVRTYVAGDPIARVARFNVYRRGHTGVWTGRVDIARGEILSVTFLPDVCPMISPEEFLMIEAAAKADQRFKAAIDRRGIERYDLVCVDPWTAGRFEVPEEANRRIAHTFVWMRMFELDNYYAHPVEGINVVVDIDTMEVLRVDDHFAETGEYVPVPTTPLNYDSAILTEYRKPSAPLDVVQPDGPGFVVEGNKVTWENWDFRVGFNGREGLVLQQVAYTIGGKRRPILYRASIAEMVVPYGNPELSHFRKNVFDSGEYGFGKLANSLTLGCDCLGHIHYFDAVVPDILGAPRLIENCICLHEEDAGLAWKHFDFRSERTEVRRLRRLVVSSITTVGNYEYASYWYLYQNGTIEYEMKASGIINTAACIPGTPQKYGTEVAPGVVGHIHQHVFCARLDMEVDGGGNTVMECDSQAVPLGPKNPNGNAFFVEERPLKSELEAQRCVDFEKMRYWKIVNPNVKNWTGRPTGYKLEAGSAVQPFTHPEGPSGRRAGFAYKHLWVTPFHPDERFPAGDFVHLSKGGEGLPTWTKQDRPVENADLVVWHSFGLHHLPRNEDHPVQPCVLCGFKLMPTGFFDQNPIIDLPPGKNHASRSTAAGKSCCHS